MKKVLFLHGLESQPGGFKPRYLKEKGYRVFNPWIQKSSFEESVKIAQHKVDTESPDVIVGSSRGGTVAMCIEPRGAKLVLIAPAWKRFNLPHRVMTVKSECVILHSEADDVVSIDDSIQLTELDGTTLIKAGEDHRMNDTDALEALLDAVKWVTHQ